MLWVQRSRELERIRFDDCAPADSLNCIAQFLDLAFGHRQERFGCTVPYPLPGILESYFSLCGRWPAPYPDRSPVVFENDEESYFYVGVQSAHLSHPGSLKAVTPFGFKVFSEHSGNWAAYVGEGYDPEVSVSVCLDGGALSDPVPSGESLSKWLVAMTLASIAWEPHNNLASGTSIGGQRSVVHQWLRNRKPIFTAAQTLCPEVGGVFSVNDGLLIHEIESATCVAAVTPAAAVSLRKRNKLFVSID